MNIKQSYRQGLERMFINLMERIQEWNWKEMESKNHGWTKQP